MPAGSTGADIRYVDVVDEFDNHGACRFWQRDRFVNDAVFGDSFRRSQLADGTVREHWTDGPLNVSTASFHPSSKGYDAYLSALGVAASPTPPPRRPGSPAMSERPCGFAHRAAREAMSEAPGWRAFGSSLGRRRAGTSTCE